MRSVNGWMAGGAVRRPSTEKQRESVVATSGASPDSATKAYGMRPSLSHSGTEEAGATPSSDDGTAPERPPRGEPCASPSASLLQTTETLSGSLNFSPSTPSGANRFFSASTGPTCQARVLPSTSTSAAAPVASDQAAAAAAAQGTEAFSRYLAQLIAASGSFLSQPHDGRRAGAAATRPSRPMSASLRDGSSSGVCRGPAPPPRPNSAQPYGGTTVNSTTRSASVDESAMRTDGGISGCANGRVGARPATCYVLRRPRPQSATPMYTSTQQRPPPSSSAACKASAGPPGPLGRGTAPVVRVSVRRLVRPPSAASSPSSTPAAAVPAASASASTGADPPSATCTRKPVLLVRPGLRITKDTIAPAPSLAPATDKLFPAAEKVCVAPASRNTDGCPHLSSQALASSRAPAAEEAAGVFVPAALPTPLGIHRADSVASTSSSVHSAAGATSTRGRRRQKYSSSDASVGSPSSGSLSPASSVTHPVPPQTQTRPVPQRAPTPPPRSRPDAATTLHPKHAPTGLHSIVDDLREKGNERFRCEDYHGALQLYAEAVRLDPFSATLRCNRASAYLLTGQYMAALVECRQVLLTAPSDFKAHWRAGKACVYLGKIQEARRHYRAALQTAETFGSQSEVRRASASLGSLSGSGGHAQQIKWLRERKAVQAEEASLDAVDSYMVNMHREQHAEAHRFLTRCLEAFSGGAGGAATGMGSLPWRVKLAELDLYTDPHRTLETTKALKKECLQNNGGDGNHGSTPPQTPTGKAFLGPDLDVLHAKALFFCAHDANSTALCLRLLSAARNKIAVQQSVVEANIKALDEVWARGGCGVTPAGPMLGFDAAAWQRVYRVEEDSRVVELRNVIEQFARCRDQGNEAYLAGRWTAAYDAYAVCLTLGSGGHNKSLLSTTYCNRSAVCMQANRWLDALSDATEAIRHNPRNDKAYGRRARIHLHLFHHQPQAEGDAARRRHLDCAVEDLRQCVELLTAVPEERQAVVEQLAKAQQLRQEFLLRGGSRPSSAAPPPPPPPRQRSASNQGGSSAPWGRTEMPRGFFSSANFARGGSTSEAHPRRSSTSSSSSSAAARTPAVGVAAYLAVLGLPTHTARVEASVLTRAYRRAALQWHPDKWVSGTAEERVVAERRFKELNVAYQALKDAATTARV